MPNLSFTFTYAGDTNGTTLGTCAGARVSTDLDNFCNVANAGAPHVTKTSPRPSVVSDDPCTTDAENTLDQPAPGVLMDDEDLDGELTSAPATVKVADEE